MPEPEWDGDGQSNQQEAPLFGTTGISGTTGQTFSINWETNSPNASGTGYSGWTYAPMWSTVQPETTINFGTGVTTVNGNVELNVDRAILRPLTVVYDFSNATWKQTIRYIMGQIFGPFYVLLSKLLKKKMGAGFHE